MCKMYGAYVGEVIRKAAGGEWALDTESSPGETTVCLQKGTSKIWPASKVRKRIANGPEDNVWRYSQFVLERWDK